MDSSLLFKGMHKIVPLMSGVRIVPKRRLNKVQQMVIYYLLRLLGRPASRTEIVKLLFLVDLELVSRGKRPLFHWIRWYYGPFSRDILDSLDILEENGLVETNRIIDEHTLGFRRIEYRAIDVQNTRSVSSQLDHVIRLSVEKVVKEWKNRSLEQLLSYVYSLPLVRGKKLGEVIELEHQL